MNRSAMDRREAIKHALIACGGAAVGMNLFSACGPNPPPPCPPGSDAPLSWGPSVLDPVFYGYADYNVGTPSTTVRVYYPSLDGSPQNAPFVCGPGLFPLVIFLHGQCAETMHYTKWWLLPTVLARSGFVVAIPDLGGVGDPWDLNNATYPVINATLSWMRSGWPHRAFLMPSMLGIVGHSYGALHGGQLAATIPVTAYVSLSGPWDSWALPPSTPSPLFTITVPKLFAFGTEELYPPLLSQSHWDSLSSPKYRLRFTGGEHWDYIPSSTCASLAGPCGVVPYLTADITALFLSKFMPPDGASLNINDSLVLPPRPPNQPYFVNGKEFFISGHMQSLQMMAAQPSCHADLSWSTSGQPGTRMLP